MNRLPDEEKAGKWEVSTGVRVRFRVMFGVLTVSVHSESGIVPASGRTQLRLQGCEQACVKPKHNCPRA